MELLVVLVAGLVVGGAAGWLWRAAHERRAGETDIRSAQERAVRAEGIIDEIRRQHAALQSEAAELRGELAAAASRAVAAETQAAEAGRNLKQQINLLEDAEVKLSHTFKSLAVDILKSSSESFLTLASERLDSVHKQASADLEARQKAIENIVAPARESLIRLDQELRTIEQGRREAQGSLTEQLRSLSSQTNRLVDALKSPTVRGRWGEVQLRRVVEIAGMVEHCDFNEQAGVATEEGRLRPDMIINLPLGKSVIVDAKVPLQAYMEALDATSEEQRVARLRDHARQIRSHIEQLSSKAYWDAFDHAPEFVVLFLPGEMFFSAALQQDPSLIEDAAIRKVILATPTTLIALLKAVAYGWRQEKLAENAERISRLAQELHDRIAVMNDHLTRLGSSLGGAVRAFNDAVGSFQSRVLPATRRFKEMGAAGKREIEQVGPIDHAPRELATGAVENGYEESQGK
jgi:DNA recombination protein RmuC